MTREAFQALVSDALAERDRQRKARLLDPLNYADADSRFITTVTEAAGYTIPAEVTAKAEKTMARSRKKNEDAAFGKAS